MNSGTITLKNNIKLIYVQDKTKNKSNASIIVNFGGMYTSFTYNNKKYNIPEGMAHFMEHLLIDSSIYGNAYNYFKDNYVYLNGQTSNNFTSFHMYTVHDFEEYLVKLIEIVNIKAFDEKSIKKTLPPVIEEARREKDNKFRCLNKIQTKAVFNSIKYLNSLGTDESLSKINYDLVSKYHDILYNPSNQIITISGNFDLDRIKKLVEDTYDRINKKIYNFKYEDFKEEESVNKKEDSYICDTTENYTRLVYKINIKKFSPYNRVKLSFYLHYFLKYNFGPSSYTYKDIVDNKISVYDIDYSCNVINNFYIIEIGTFTNKKEDFIKIIKKVIDKKETNLEYFTLQKNSTIIDLLLREESPSETLYPLISNIIEFGYNDIDKISDIENETYEDYTKTINELNFSNYSIVNIEKEK